jgi:hypothetical protein
MLPMIPSKCSDCENGLMACVLSHEKYKRAK